MIPTAAAGLVDWSGMDAQTDRRVGVAHALSNFTAAALYVLSWQYRRRDRYLRGVALGLVAAAAGTGGGLLGATSHSVPKRPATRLPRPECGEFRCPARLAYEVGIVARKITRRTTPGDEAGRHSCGSMVLRSGACCGRDM